MASALKASAAVAAVCLVLMLISVGQPAAAAFTLCGDCLEQCGRTCDRYRELTCNSLCYGATKTPGCDATCQQTTCQTCMNAAFPECVTKCSNGCNTAGVCPTS